VLPDVHQDFNNQYKSYGRLDTQSMKGADLRQPNLPSMTEFEFGGKYRDKMLQQFPKANMPHMKRIINNQVFLEESEPYISEDYLARRNTQAISTAQQMISPTQQLPLLGPQSESARNMFYVPKYGTNSVGQQPTSYMTQGQYQAHPIFNS